MRQFTFFLSDTIFIALIYMQSTNNFMLANDAILVYDDQIYVEGDNENSDSSHELTEMIREERPKWQPKPSIRDDKKEVKSCLWKEVVDLRIPGCLLPGRSIYSSFNRSFLGKGGRRQKTLGSIYGPRAFSSTPPVCHPSSRRDCLPSSKSPEEKLPDKVL